MSEKSGATQGSFSCVRSFYAKYGCLAAKTFPCVVLLLALSFDAARAQINTPPRLQPIPAQLSAQNTARLARRSSLFRAEFAPSQIQARGLTTINLKGGVRLNLRRYIAGSRLTVSPQIAPLLRANIQTRFLNAKPVHVEKIIQLSDRIVVERHLKITLKRGTCQQRQLPNSISELCFKRKPGTLNSDMRARIGLVRQRLRRAPPNRIVRGTLTARQALAMSDAQLLELIINTGEREIRHVSVIPLQIHPVILNQGLRFQQQGRIMQFRRPMIVAKPMFKPPRKRLSISQTFELVCRSEQFKRNRKRPATETEWAAMVKAARRGSKACIKREQARQERIRQRAQLRRGLAMFKNMERKKRARHDKKLLKFTKRYFLTGFTFGREYSNDYEFTFAGKTWFTDRYYVNFRYYVGVGFGVRLPYSVQVKAKPMVGKKRAIEVVARPIKADARGRPVYRNVGLQRRLYFKGEEFFFVFAANCRLYASIPGPNFKKSCPSINKSIGSHLTPSLGRRSAKIKNVWFNGKVTQLGLSAWVGGAYLDIGLGAKMSNGRIGYRITPHANGRLKRRRKSRNVWVSTTNPFKFNITRKKESRNWGFTLDQPKYKFRVEITPLIRISLRLDLGVYELNKSLGPYSFDSLSIGRNFDVSRHDGTTRAHNFSLSR